MGFYITNLKWISSGFRDTNLYSPFKLNIPKVVHQNTMSMFHRPSPAPKVSISSPAKNGFWVVHSRGVIEPCIPSPAIRHYSFSKLKKTVLTTVTIFSI